MTEKDLVIQNLRRENEALRAVYHEIAEDLKEGTGMTIKEALDDIVTSGINLGAGDFVDLEALEVAARVLEKIQWISVKDRLPDAPKEINDGD